LDKLRTWSQQEAAAVWTSSVQLDILKIELQIWYA